MVQAEPASAMVAKDASMTMELNNETVSNFIFLPNMLI
jgi:hypothetical protein